MIEKWLPASLKNSDNPFYEYFLSEADSILDEFVDTKIRTIKNIYSISDASREDLFEIANKIYLVDENTLNMIYNFLNTQLTSSESIISNIKKIISVYNQIELNDFDREIPDGQYMIHQFGVVMSTPGYSDFSDDTASDYFRSFMTSYVPGITISRESNDYYFIYPIGSTQEMKDNFKQSIYNSLCDYAINYIDGFQDLLDDDPISMGFVSRIDNLENKSEIFFNNFNHNEEDRLGQIIKFVISYSSYEVDDDNKSLVIYYSSSSDVSLEKLKDEISKLSFSIANRGTISFYTSILNTLGYNYPGVIGSMRSFNESRVDRLVDGIDITIHPVEGSNTKFVPVSIYENLDGIELTSNTLDYNKGTDESPVYDTLDMKSDFAKLDQISIFKETMYKKDVLLGVLLNHNAFKGDSIYPYEFSRFQQELIALNQKTTDVIHLTPIISLDIDKDDLNPEEISIISIPESNPFIEIKNGTESFDYISQTDYDVRMDAYEYDSKTQTFNKFYEHYLYPSVDCNYNSSFAEGDAVFTYKGCVEGKRYKASKINCVVESSNKITVQVPDKKYLTNKIIIKLFEKESEESNFFLFKENNYGYFEQCAGPIDASGDFRYVISVSINDDTITFESNDSFASILKNYQVTFTSEKVETKISKVTFTAIVEQNEIQINEFTFKDNDQILSVDLPSNVDLMFVISRHEGAIV